MLSGRHVMLMGQSFEFECNGYSGTHRGMVPVRIEFQLEPRWKIFLSRHGHEGLKQKKSEKVGVSSEWCAYYDRPRVVAHPN